jgi:membrane-bound PQQ-dependent dehydrogenase (glucose/quinate/shikimate family)
MESKASARRIFARLLALVIACLAVAQGVGGFSLISLGGSPYYFITAVAMLTGAVMLWLKHRWTRLAFHALLAGTIAWALWETSGEMWGMIARVSFFIIMWLLVLSVSRERNMPAGPARVAAIVLLLLAGTTVGTLIAQDASLSTSSIQTADDAAAQGEWPQYGRTPGSTRFSPLTQLTPANVRKLKVAWIYRTGDLPRKSDEGLEFTFEATPLKVGDTLYLCTPHNVVIALDAETGTERWRYDPKVNDRGSYIKVCRGVAYYKAGMPVDECPERILAATLDGRMVAVDAKTGQPCSDFGAHGETSILTGLGPHKLGMTYQTSAPFIVGRVALVGGLVIDSYSTGEPSGSLRAYDVITGKFVWAWDMGRPGETKEPPPGETFTKGTPNIWAPMSADLALGLVFLSTGNATPDYWAGYRNEVMDKYSSSIVALDIATGQPRWYFQTVHHDVWDYDVPSSAILFDFKRGGETTPALAQFTKMGQLFVLDRRTGEPLISTEERPVPQGAPPGDWLSATQPFSTAPTLMPSKLTEASMWGLTPLDQIACRIAFRSHRYEGIYTPQSVTGTIEFPGPYGTTDWGSATYDEDRGLLIAPSSYVPMIIQLVPREEIDKRISAINAAGKDPASVAMSPQYGTPYGTTMWPMFSPLKIPCTAPPWGYLTAISPNANKIVWQKPFGTARDSGPFQWKVGPPVAIGVPSMGGPISTRSGLTFIGAAVDNYFRAFDSATGKELWRGRIPAGAQATPLTYWSSKSRRQFVVVSAGGHSALMTTLGDYVIAYALPKENR